MAKKQSEHRENPKEETHQKSLKKTEKSWDGLLEVLPDPTYIITPVGRIVEVNKEAINRLGYSRQEFLQKNIFDLALPEIAKTFPVKIKEIVEKKSVQFESIHFSKKGESIPVDVNARLITINGKQAIIAITRDISKLKQTERILKESEQRYKSIFGTNSYAIIILDKQGVLIESNDFACQLYQYNRDEFSSIDLESISAENSYEQILPKFEECLLKGKQCLLEAIEVKKDGSEFYAEMAFSQINIKGEAHVLVIITDISERKKTETALIESENLKSLLLESSSEMFTYYDDKLNIVYTNSKSEIISKKSNGELTSTKCHEIFYDNSKPCKECHVYEAIKTGVYQELANKTIGDRDYNFRAYPIKNKKNNVIGVAEFGLDVTAERKAKEKLEKSEAKFRTLSNATFESILITSSGILIETNQTAAEMFDYSINELRNKEITSLFAPDYRKIIQNRLTGVKDKPVDIIGLKKDGQLFDAQVRIKSMDYKGQVVKVMAVRDITAKKRTENIQSVVFKIANAVNITKDLVELFNVIRLELSRVIDTSNFIISLYDENSDTISSPFFVDEKDSFTSLPIGKSLTKYLLKEKTGLLLHQSEIEKLIKSKEVVNKGEICKVWLGVPLKASNRIIGALIVQSYSDENAYSTKDLEMLSFVSTQIGLSVERKVAENALRENEEKLRAFFESGVAGTCFCSTSGIVKNANKEFKRILGYANNEIVGEKIDWKKQTPKEFYVLDEQKMLEAKLNGSCTPYEKQLINFNGKIIWVLIGYVLIGEAKDQMIVFMLDLTDRKNFELKLKESREKAEESDRLKTAFLANMSHEIRTPMNAIVGFTSFLEDPYYNNEEKSEFVTVIQKNVNSLLSLIDDIIDISKIESGELRIRKVEFSLNTLLKEVYHSFNELIVKSEKSNVVFEICKLDDSNDVILFNDPNRLRQVLTNLLSNAFKFTQDGSIKISYELKGNTIQFCVCDTGIGMTSEDISIIFDRFSQAKNTLTREHGGTGLGLTISKNLVNFLGGDLWVDSKLGVGSKFFFNLPYNKEAKDQINQPENSVLELQTAPDWTGKKILIAEDIDSNFRILEKILEPTHVSLIWVKQGDEAVRVCKQDLDIDAVLMDVQMPEMNGYEATQNIKKFRKDIPVVAITAFAMSNEKEKSKQAGCDEYIPKPIRKQRLYAVLHSFLGHK